MTNPSFISDEKVNAIKKRFNLNRMEAEKKNIEIGLP